MIEVLPFVVAGLATAGVYVLSGVGIVVLYRASGVINLSQGALGALAALIAWNIDRSTGGQLAGWLIGIAAATALSVAYGRLIAPRLAKADPMVQAIATLAFAIILMGAMNIVWGELPRRLRLPTDAIGVELFGVRVTYTRILAFGLSIAVAVAVFAFLRFTRLGLAMRAVADNRELASLRGVQTGRADLTAWFLSGVLSAVSGLIFADLTRFSAQSLTFLVVPAVATALLGGLVSLPVTVLGGIAIGVGEAVLTLVPGVSSYRSAVVFVVATLAIIWSVRRPSNGFVVRI